MHQWGTIRERFTTTQELIRQADTKKLSNASSRFKAAGVILTRDDSRVYVSTALHNVYVLAAKEDAPVWSDAMVTSFKDQIKIYYGAHVFGGEPTKVATITSAKPIHLDSAKKNWEYDILLLKSETAEFKTYAATAGNAVYPSFSDAGEFVTQAWEYLDKGAGRTPSIFVQTGYGKIERFKEISDGSRKVKKKVFPADNIAKNKGTNIEGKLQYRIAAPTSSETTSVYRQIGKTENYEECKHCVVLSADGNNSTEEGDSGAAFCRALCCVRKRV